MKTAIRNINDALFTSSIAALLFSYSKLLDVKGDITLPEALFSLYFILFRIKAYLDDNYSLRVKEINHEPEKISTQKDPQKPNDLETNLKLKEIDIADALLTIASLLSWLAYSVSGYYIFFNPLVACCGLILSFLIISLYILGKAAAASAMSPDGKKYLWLNVLYIIFLCLLAYDLTLSNQKLQFIPLAVLYTVLIIDFAIVRSLRKIYA